MSAFLERPGELLSREELLERVWSDRIVEEANLTQSVFVLRKLLGDTGPEHRLIATEPGRGYRFIAEVVPAPEEPRAVEEPRATGAPPTGRPAWKVLAALAAALLVALGLALTYPTSDRGRPVEPTGGFSSLAVLPFTAIGSDEPDVLGPGLADAVATELAADDDLVVRPVTTVLADLSAGALPAEVGRKLRVDAILEGTLVRSGQTVRVTARLISTESEKVVWSTSFRQPAADLFELQETVAARLAAALLPGLPRSGLDGAAGLSARRGTSFRTYEAFLEGGYHMAARNGQGLGRARAAFRRALELDPRYAPAWSGLATAELLLGFYRLGELPPAECYRAAVQAARRAVELDPSLPRPHTVLGMLAMLSAHDLETAERHMLRALAAAPDEAFPHHWYAWVLVSGGRPEEAAHEIEIAYRIDPTSLIVRSAKSYLAYYAGDYERALRGFDGILALDQRFGRAHLNRGLALEQLGRFEEAEEAFRRAAEALGETDEVRAALAHLYGRTGRRRAWESLMRDWERSRPSPALLLFAYAGVGDDERVLSLLGRAVERREVWVWELRYDPRLAPFREDPAFERVAAAIWPSPRVRHFDGGLGGLSRSVKDGVEASFDSV